MPDIGHAVLFSAESQRPLPRRIVSVKEEGPNIRLDRMKSGLENPIGQTIANVHPLATRSAVTMIQIAVDMNHLVIRAIAIDDESLVPGHFARQPGPVELVAKTQLRRPLEDKEDRLGRFDIERELERGQDTRTTIESH